MKQVKLSVRDVNAIADSRLFWKYIWRIVGCVGALFILVILLAVLAGIGADKPKDIIYEPLFDDVDNVNLVLTSDWQIAEYDGYYWKYVKQDIANKTSSLMVAVCVIVLGSSLWFLIWYTKLQTRYREQTRKEFNLEDKTVEIK